MLRVSFLRWWLFVAVVSVLSVGSWNLGAFHEIYEADTTPCTFIIYTLVVGASFFCGWKTWRLSTIIKKGDINSLNKRSAVARVSQNGEIGWFISDICLTVGMVGTVWGFITMFRGDNLASVDVSNTTSMLALIGSVAKGMSIALYTTLVGLIGSAILKVQYFNLSHAIEGQSFKTQDVEIAELKREVSKLRRNV